MKKTLLFVLKTGLIVFFIYNLGIVNYILDTEKHPPTPYNENFREELDWLNGKYESALKLGAQYSPELYFSDITEIQLKQNNNEFDRRSQLVVSSTLSGLANIFHQNFSNLRFKSKASQADLSLYLKRVDDSSDKYEEALNPGITQRRQEFNLQSKTLNYWLNSFSTILLWLLNQYLKNLLPAFLLLWIWWYQEKKTLKIINPLSFIFCLIIYPVIIIGTWKQKINQQARYLIMTVDYRQRQRNLFALFSENEIQELKRFARSNISIQKCRQNLNADNQIVRHSFFSALVVTVILIVFSEQKSFAESIASHIRDVNKTEQLENAPPQTLTANYTNFVVERLALDEKANLSFFLSEIIRFYFKKGKCLQGFTQDIKHVPKLVSSIYLKYLLVTKKLKNEKYIYFIGISFIFVVNFLSRE